MNRFVFVGGAREVPTSVYVPSTVIHCSLTVIQYSTADIHCSVVKKS